MEFFFALTTAEFLDGIPIIISLILIEGLLSIDNALAIASMASHLPGRQKYMALRLGIIGAYLFRGLALWAAVYIMHNPAIMLIGAGYLIYLLCRHFVAAQKSDATEEEIRINKPGLIGTIIQIEFMDLALSVDNVVAAIALAPGQFWAVVTGVFIGILALRFVAGYCFKLIERFPILEHTAFLLLGFVGLLLVTEIFSGVNIDHKAKFIGIIVLLALSIWYEKSARLRAVLRPVIWTARPLMHTVVFVIHGILMYPFRMTGLWIKRTFFRPAKAG